jgi:hypothetical protein
MNTRSFVDGLLIIFGCACVSVALYFSYIGVTKSESTSIPKFQKVDSYNGCSVIQYTPENRATSQFFLDCSEKTK